MVDSQYYLPNDIGISALDCREAFRLLSPKEQMYAHYLSRASWYGGLIVLIQTSPESANIFVLLQKMFRAQAPQQLEAAATAAGLSAEEYQVKKPVTNTKVNISSVFIVVTTLCLFSGLPCICCWAVCKHGKLQVIWGHQIHPQPTKGHIPYLICPMCALSECIVISQRFKCFIILPILICRRSSRLWCGRVWPLNRALVTRRRCGAAAVSPFTP